LKITGFWTKKGKGKHVYISNNFFAILDLWASKDAELYIDFKKYNLPVTFRRMYLSKVIPK
jgi:hypothetical protein